MFCGLLIFLMIMGVLLFLMLNMAVVFAGLTLSDWFFNQYLSRSAPVEVEIIGTLTFVISLIAIIFGIFGQIVCYFR